MLTDNEMLNIEGGAVSWGFIGIVGTILTFIAGVVDGYLRPSRCN